VSVSEVGEERIQGLLRMSRASGVGLKNALSRLETEREAGRKQLEESRAREARLRKDLARREAAASAGERQVSALRQALQAAQKGTAQLPAPPTSKAAAALARDESEHFADSVPLDELAEALRRRRARTRAFRSWVKKSHASVLLLLSERLAVQSACLRVLKRWRCRFPAALVPGRFAGLSAVAVVDGADLPLGSPASSPGKSAWVTLSMEELALRRWRELAASRHARAAAAARVRLSHRRRGLRRGLRAWRGAHHVSRQRSIAWKHALRQALRRAELRCGAAAIGVWRAAVAAVLTEQTAQLKQEALQANARKSEVAWREERERLLFRSEAALRRSEEAAQAEKRQQERHEARLRAELEGEQLRLLDALQAQRAAVTAANDSARVSACDCR
jgi:hypothetical protein